MRRECHHHRAGWALRSITTARARRCRRRKRVDKFTILESCNTQAYCNVSSVHVYYCNTMVRTRIHVYVYQWYVYSEYTYTCMLLEQGCIEL